MWVTLKVRAAAADLPIAVTRGFWPFRAANLLGDFFGRFPRFLGLFCHFSRFFFFFICIWILCAHISIYSVTMEILKPYRKRLDDLDDRIIDLLVERTGIIEEVGHLKAREGLPAVLPDRVEEVRERCVDRAREKGLSPELVRELYTRIIDFSCNFEEEIKQDLLKKKQA